MKDVKNWVAINCSLAFKLLTPVIMMLLATLIIYDRIDCNVDVGYFNHPRDTHLAWIFILYAIAVAQLVLLLHIDCYKCRVIGDLLLQVSGVLILIIDWIFVVQHPPYNTLMFALPIWGLGMIIAGRFMGHRSRWHIKEQRKEKNE